jgi:hypothetical protein
MFMPYTHIFEVVLLFALIVGICFGWKDRPIAKEEPQSLGEHQA